MTIRNILVIGASAGGIAAVRQLLSSLPADLDASVLITTHMAPDQPSYLAEILAKDSPLRVSPAVDDEPLRSSHVYISVPDRHLLVEHDRMRLFRGPRESNSRPSIDVLFRSAAVYHGPRVTGVVLTGCLDDGTAGLWAIKERGGMAIVQSPNEAEFPSMPLSAMTHVRVDHVLTLDGMSEVIQKRVRAGMDEHIKAPPKESLEIETRIALGERPLKFGIGRLGNPSVYTCPECHGSLAEIREGSIRRYRCHTGHAYSERSLARHGLDFVELSVRSTISHLEEIRVLLAEMQQSAEGLGDVQRVTNYGSSANEIDDLLTRMRGVASHPAFAHPHED